MKKIDFEFIKRNKRDILFGLVGIVLIVAILLVFINAVSFLVANVQSALDVSSSKTQPVRFNLKALKELGVLNPNEQLPAK